jgi:hypothetical protein
MRLSFSPVGNYYLVAVLAAVLLVLLFIGPARQQLPGRRRGVLVSLRLLVILLVILAMLRPTLVHSDIVKQSATLVVLADRSRSMQVTDAVGKKSRWEVMVNALNDAKPALDDLRKAGLDVQGYTFDREAHPLDLMGDVLDVGTMPDGRQTAMGAVLEDILRREAGKRLAGVILLGDGAQRADSARDVPPQVAARRLADLGYPLYTVPLGQSRGLGQTRDVAVEELLVPQTVFVKNQLPVTGTVRVEGYVNQNISVQLLFETSPGKMEPIAASQIHAREDGQRLPIEMNYVPQVPGEFKVTLKVAPQPGELVTSNNEMSSFVTVLKGGLNVLYIEGVARVEQKFLRRALDASPDIKVDYLRIDARRPETRPSDMSLRFKPGKYDVYMLGDVDSAAFRVDELESLAANVNRGAGLIMLGGFHSFGPGGYGRTPLADVLPIEIDRLERQNFNEPIRADLQWPGPLHMRPTAIGDTQSLMLLANRDQNAAAWAKLPALEGANRFQGLKPGAQVLAESDSRKPLLVAKDYGLGRVIAFAADSTWHWWMTGHEKTHQRFWRQMVLWLARKDQSAEGNVWIALDERRYSPGARVEFKLGANAPDGTAIHDADFKVEIITPDRRSAPVRLRRQGDDTLGLFLDAQTPGDYTVRAEGSRKGQVIGTRQARFLVNEEDLELDNPAADRSTMENLAAMTGGRAIAPEQLPELLAQIKAGSKNLEVETQVKETLWDTWPFFLAFVMLLSIEWYLRKRWGLV